MISMEINRIIEREEDKSPFRTFASRAWKEFNKLMVEHKIGRIIISDDKILINPEYDLHEKYLRRKVNTILED